MHTKIFKRKLLVPVASVSDGKLVSINQQSALSSQQKNQRVSGRKRRELMADAGF
jgi:hypothetical protein